MYICSPVTASFPIKTRARVSRSKGCDEVHTSGTNSSVASIALVDCEFGSIRTRFPFLV
jgi:hypothetical protein